jgi:hypothetical protein
MLRGERKRGAGKLFPQRQLTSFIAGAAAQREKEREEGSGSGGITWRRGVGARRGHGGGER